VRLGLLGERGTRHADLTLDGRDSLAGELAERARDARRAYALGRLAAKLLDALGDAALVVARLLQVLLQALLVRRLLRQADVSREICLQLRFLGMSLVEELDELGVTSVELGH
jgi:hypothetical protein